MRRSSLLAAVAVLTACATEKAPQPASTGLPAGEHKLAVPGGRLWYKVTGTGKGTPVVLVHGGPGFSSYYLKSFEELGDDRVVIRYDQLGGGKSDKITDTAMFNIPHFVAELDSLRSALGYPKWHVFGHSWGTILGLEYYRAHPDRVTSLTFGSAVFDAKAYVSRARQLLTTLPDSVQRAIKKADATGKFDSPEYQNAINQFYALYVFRNPVPADLDSLFATANEGIYNYMQGPSEFTIVGTLKDYDVKSFLPQIKVPTLLTVGEFDEVGPELIKRFAGKVPGARYVVFSGAAHMTPWDARDENVRVVREFLRSADSTAAAGR
ncbi:MAG: proline iminopeptidase-family hydrolase [Gemmatimonadetes bacterium]|nr:proline iminopeptidase-family hydrolase [Gemmatimonadota bacterium]